MTVEPTLKLVINRLNEAVATLEREVDAHLVRAQNSADADEEVQRMNADRSRLAQDLDTCESRAQRLEGANKEVSRRLVTAMETIRAVLDR